jgi:ribosome-binding factor A
MPRIERVDAEIQKMLSTLINFELKDPRIDATVTVARVETKKDLSNCKVWVIAPSSADIKGLINGLNASKSFLKASLFKGLRIRSVPDLTFIQDRTDEYGNRITELLGEINAKRDN